MVKEESHFKLQEDQSKSLHLGLPGAILSCGLTYNARLAASCSSNQKILLWDINGGKCVGSLDGHKNDVTSCSFGKELLASGSRDGVLFLWKYRQLKRVSAISKCKTIHTLLYISNRFIGNYPKNTSRVFYVETTWKQRFLRRSNMEYTWCVCRVYLGT